ncbi:helix-turn-helix transcriptional regulator [Streptomyces hoynatensis]|uniref:Transcriptional regulator n=1 Tax=Streptomyces hoynatensis TaxID=1141874 RepID=A0A3A9YHV0_9ACTN|nr:helix-turn-helix transcriptional regulator [Streptomyces hoynatensis]RKN36680.1 transcriptional regulator [Streptomyces hoynatensis]
MSRAGLKPGRVARAAAGRPAAGPSPSPLVLSAGTARRLRGAVRALLDDPAVAGLPDPARLAAVVLLAKARSADLVTEVCARELGRWLGLSGSAVSHAVRPALTGTDVVHVREARAVSGRVTGLEWLVMPAWRARHEGAMAHPLRLERAELAVLLRLCEALFGPGWSHRDGSVTPPGVLGRHTGRGAATDRLALLLAALDARADGTVRLCPGSVDERRGRPAATIARLLGCTAAGGEAVLGRLRKAGVVETPQRTTADGMAGKARLVVLAVAAAHRAARRRGTAEIPAFERDSNGSAPIQALAGSDATGPAAPGRARPGKGPAVGSASLRGVPAPAAAAPGDQGHGRPAPGVEEVQVSGADRASDAGVAGGFAVPDDLAGLHAMHAGVAEQGSESAGDPGFSGVAERGAGRRRRKHACAREDAGGPADADVTAAGGEGGCALRAEDPISPTPKPKSGYAGPALTFSARVAAVLQPVQHLVRGCSPWEARAIGTEIGRQLDAGVTPEQLRHRLAARLVGIGEHQVLAPGRWLLGSGLPRWGCGNVHCESGELWAIDWARGAAFATGTRCETCAAAAAARARAHEQHQRIAQGLCPHHGTPPDRHGQCLDCELDDTVGIGQPDILPAPEDKPAPPKRSAPPRWWECAVCRLPHRGDAPPDLMCPRCPATAAAEDTAWRQAAVRSWERHQALVDEAYAEYAGREAEAAERREHRAQAARRARERRAREQAETAARRAQLARDYPELAAVSPFVADLLGSAEPSRADGLLGACGEGWRAPGE